MGLIARRRSLVVKIILLVPIVWLGALVLFAATGSNNDKMTVGHDEAKPPGRRSVNEIQGFGPPIAMDKKEDDNDAQPDVEEHPKSGGSDEKPNIPLPNKGGFDPSLPIYKKGDSSQAGELGKAVKIDKTKLTLEEKKKYDQGFQNNAFNQYASDMISVHRSLPPTADLECKTEKYNDNLPDTSVIICFHNEAWSVLLRTVHSVLERTPEHLLKEIILVDDFSDMEHTKQPLEQYMSQFKKVKILRLTKREGLIRARLQGAAKATGDVLTYLDSHCECMEGWVEPLLDRIKRNATTVVCPVIDVIDDNTFEYHYSKAYFTNVGGFDWSLQFNWHAIPERDRKNRKRHIDPVPKYFETLGTYDPGFDIWGGENLELSFKIWMCGGTLEIVPCSHVGHIFRKRSPYKWRTGVNVLKRNSVRLAEVWLDDYKTYYYERINNQIGDFGDISDRKALRERLECKSFKWYLDNIFPELFVPGDSIAKGEVRNLADNFNPRRCLDCAVHKREKNKPVSLYPCHDQGGNQIRSKASAKGGAQCIDSAVGDDAHNKPVTPYPCHEQGGNQYWMYSKDGEIRRDESCIDYAGQDVMIFPCHSMKGNQEWKYDHKKHQLMHVVTGKCLEMTKDGAKLKMQSCDEQSAYQQWVFKEFSEEKAREHGHL
ncbi:hypothetical protein L596_023094 [Steinernema carpocapsae]|uniref:Polypeptide N-acetylgalactosaminyltransferase n=1 Tax=Steinernema carpocapsae TaxID=34508 RepID=A0A4U5MCN2_STECR|nr:hypothetical protein L596_023094 [Steinernema carpocapsae]